MKPSRPYIAYPERLAAALAMLLPQAQRDDLRARKMPADAVLALFDQDHIVLHALGGADKWWNLTPMLKGPHKQKSRRDTSIVAKTRRFEREPDKWRNLTGPKPRRVKPRSKWQSRPLRSANRWPKRKMGGRAMK